MTIEHLYTKKQAAQLRQKLIEEHISPIVKVCFKKYPQLRSATLLLAQDCYNEACNSVYENLAFSILDNLDLEAAYQAKKDRIKDEINLPGFDRFHNKYDYEELKEEGYSISWNENWDAVIAFAAFCRSCDRENRLFNESYTPYAILRRSGDDIAVEIVGQMLRPWLDGVQPSSLAGWRRR